mgnify:CR=1 FL=1
MKIPNWLVAVLLAVPLTACEPRAPTPTFTATDITGASFARDFSLTDHNGQTRTLADFRGKLVALFFGYTHCPDVCPTTMADLAAAIKLLGPDGNKVQVLFVTVDPERDTAALLKQYVPAFNPAFLGLRPTPEQLKRLAAEYKVVYQKNPGREQGNYLMDHSAGTYIYDTQGRLRLLMPYGSSAPLIASDLKVLLAH